ncbi:MAG: hypothetical protein IKZ48_00050 [Prevotella sp.]|nr:hypothetical protein [Prevotella sp.]
MKKIFLTLAAVLCCAMTTTVFTACGDDSDDSSENPAAPEFLGVATRYYIVVDSMMAELCDYTLTYYGDDNKLVTEQMKWTYDKSVKGSYWIKDVTSVVMPALVGAKMNVKLKEGAQLEGKRVGNYRPIVKRMYVTGLNKDRSTAFERLLDIGETSTSFGGSAEKIPAQIELWEQHNGVINSSYIINQNSSVASNGQIK